jgi:hypothetical protein
MIFQFLIKSCKRGPFEAKHVELTYVRRQRTEGPLTPYPGGYRRIDSNRGKAHSDTPICLCCLLLYSLFCIHIH